MAKQSDSKAPKIRFKEYEGEWEEKKLLKIGEFNPKDALPETFEYVDLESVVGTQMVYHRTESRKTAPSRAQRLARQGDLLFQNVRPYQKNNYLFTLPYHNYVFSSGYTQIRPFNEGSFLLGLVQRDRFVKVVLDHCTGTSYPAINSNVLAEIHVRVPNPEEQNKIGRYFQELDKLIGLHQRKHDKLVNLKQAMLQKMFARPGATTPEIRFTGFYKPWSEEKLHHFIEVSTEKNMDEAYGKEHVLSVSGDVGIVNQIEFQGRSFAGKSVQNYGVVKHGYIVYTK